MISRASHVATEMFNFMNWRRNPRRDCLTLAAALPRGPYLVCGGGDNLSFYAHSSGRAPYAKARTWLVVVILRALSNPPER